MYNNLVSTNVQDKDKGRHTYDHVYNIFDSIVKREIQHALNQQMYTWGYAVMNRKNCPPKMLEILNGQIKAKSTYSYLLKNYTNGIKRPIKLLDPDLNKIYNDFYTNSENEDQINEETKKIVQILNDYSPIIIPIAQICFSKDYPLSEKHVEQLNQLFSIFPGENKFCKQLPKDIIWKFQEMIKPYEKKIRQRQKKLRDPQKRKLWLQKNKIHQKMIFKPSGYRRGIIQMSDSEYNKSEVQKINGIKLFMNLFKQYIDPLFPLKYRLKCQNNDNYIPQNINTEDLIREKSELKNSEQKKQTGSISVQVIESIIILSRSQMVPEIISQRVDQGKEDGEFDSKQKSKKTKLIDKKKNQKNDKQDLRFKKNLQRLIKQDLAFKISEPFLKKIENDREESIIDDLEKYESVFPSIPVDQQDLQCQSHEYIQSLIEQGLALNINEPFFKNQYSYLDYNQSISWNIMNNQKINRRSNAFNVQKQMEDEIFYREGKNLRSNNFKQYKL